MARQTGGFGGNALPGAAVAKDGGGMVVDEVKAVLVEDGGRVPLGDGEPDSIPKALAERASGDLDAGGVVGLGVSGSDAADLAEVLEIVHGQAVAKEVQE